MLNHQLALAIIAEAAPELIAFLAFEGFGQVQRAVVSQHIDDQLLLGNQMKVQVCQVLKGRPIRNESIVGYLFVLDKLACQLEATEHKWLVHAFDFKNMANIPFGEKHKVHTPLRSRVPHSKAFGRFTLNGRNQPRKTLYSDRCQQAHNIVGFVATLATI